MVSLAVDTSLLVDTQGSDAADVVVPIVDLKTHQENVLNGVQAFDQIKAVVATELTISGGVVTRSLMNHRIDTEGNAASDDLTTILGGSEGMILFVRLENASRVVTLKHGADNLLMAGGGDVILTNTDQVITFFYVNGGWREIGGGMPALGLIIPVTAISGTPTVITINNIEQSFRHLKVWAFFRKDTIGAQPVNLTFNNDTGSNYANGYQRQNFSLGNVQSFGVSGAIELDNANIGSDAVAGYTSVVEVTIFNYADGSRPRHCRFEIFAPFADTAVNAFLIRGAGTWKNSSQSITRLDFTCTGGITFVPPTAYALQGIR